MLLQADDKPAVEEFNRRYGQALNTSEVHDPRDALTFILLLLLIGSVITFRSKAHIDAKFESFATLVRIKRKD